MKKVFSNLARIVIPLGAITIAYNSYSQDINEVIRQTYGKKYECTVKSISFVGFDLEKQIENIIEKDLDLNLPNLKKDKNGNYTAFYEHINTRVLFELKCKERKVTF